MWLRPDTVMGDVLSTREQDAHGEPSSLEQPPVTPTLPIMPRPGRSTRGHKRTSTPRRTYEPAWLLFGRLVATEMRRLGLSSTDLARRLGLEGSMVRHVATGRIPPPLDAVGEWATALRLHGARRRFAVDLGLLAHAPEALLRRFELLDRGFAAGVGALRKPVASARR
jgi:hypothetical protein